MPPRFPDVAFASFLVYPSGRKVETPSERKAKNVVLSMKQLRVSPQLDPPHVLDYVFSKFELALAAPPLQAFFATRGFAVMAAPGSSLTQPFSVSCPPAIAMCFKHAGLASRVLPPVHRITPVLKSASAASKDRPSVLAHYQSMGLPLVLEAPDDILVVDDVVTSGATLLAAVTIVREAYPRARVRAFAIARTDRVPEGRITDPVVGTIALRGARAVRRP